MRRRRGHIKKIVLLLLSVEILAIVGLLAYIQIRPMVVKAVTMEAGTDVLTVEDFLMYKNRKGSLVTNIQELTDPGIYEIEIKIGNRIHSSSLEITDTVAPTAIVIDQMVLRDEVIEPLSFVSDITDATDVTVAFKDTPDTGSPGDKKVTLLLTDQGGNVTELYANLTVLDIRNSVTIEAGSPMNITVDDFVDHNSYEISFLTDLSTIDISKPKIHKIDINVNGRVVSGNIAVVDTTPPQVTYTDQQVWKNDQLPADAFIKSILDVSGVTLAYKAEPNFTIEGDQEITIVLKDDYGNITEQTANLTIIADTQAPIIMGTRDKTVFVGDGVSYRKGVYVTDNREEDLKVSVDSSAVNLKKVGSYEVIYSAEDSSGNKTSITNTVSVIEFVVSQEMVDEKTDEVLAKIMKDHMTKLEKAEAIYHWIKSKVGYTGDSDKTNWLAEAYRAMEDGEGDCFTFYAVAQALLTRAGIDNMQVTRLGGKTRHYWNLIDCGDGWYHFDSCPNKDHVETFMLTDEELDAFTATRGSYYYNRDKSLYPATSEVSIQSKVLQ